MKNLYKNITLAVALMALTACGSAPKQIVETPVQYYLHGMRTDSVAILKAHESNPALVCVGNDTRNLDGFVDGHEIRCW